MSLFNPQQPPPQEHSRIARFKLGVVELIGLVFFLILVTDTAVTELSPIVKHIWHTLFGP